MQFASNGVANSSNQSVAVSVTAVSQQTGLLTTNSSSATVTSLKPAQFLVTPNISGLKPGIYTGLLQFQFADGSIQEVTILVIVTQAAHSTVLRTSIHGAAASSSCTPAQLLPVSTVLGPGSPAHLLRLPLSNL